MRVALLWWPIRGPGGAAQATRGNLKGLQALDNVDVDFYQSREDSITQFPDRIPEYDLVIYPFLHFSEWFSEDRREDTHWHLQIGGHAGDEPTRLALEETLEVTDTASVLDPNLAVYFNDRFDFPMDDVAVIPNPPNTDHFPLQPHTDSSRVFVPQIGTQHKQGRFLAKVADVTPDIRYIAHAKAMDTDGVYAQPDNVDVIPPVPFSAMPGEYRDCAVVLSGSQREGLPNVAYEAFCSARPYVSKPRAIGRIQSLPQDKLDPAWFGRSTRWWLENVTAYYDGEHCHVHEYAQFVADMVRRFVDDTAARRAAGDQSRAWIDAVFDQWGWAEKARAILDVVENDGPVGSGA